MLLEQNNIQLRPSVQGNIQICQPEGEHNPPRVDKSGCIPTQRAVIVLLYFCQCFIGYLPYGGKLGCSAGNKQGCSAGNNRVVSRQRNFSPMFYRLSPLWGEIGLFRGEQYTITALCVGKHQDLSTTSLYFHVCPEMYPFLHSGITILTGS